MSTDTTPRGAMVIHQNHGLSVLRPQTLGEAIELAGHLAKSNLVPKDYRGKPEDVLVAMQLGAEVGLSPFQALQSIAVINGRPGVFGDAGLGIVMASGFLEDMDETDDEEKQKATCWMIRKGGRRVERTFSHADAEKVTMYERDHNNNPRQIKLSERPMWKSFPKRMRQMRARWWVMRDLFPDVLKGLVGREEHEPDASPIPPSDVIEAQYETLMPREKVVDAADVVVPPATGAVEAAVITKPDGAVVEVITPPAPTGTAEATAAAHEAMKGTAPVEQDTRPLPEETPKDPARSFEINGRTFMTEGITRDQLMLTFSLAVKVDRAKGKNTAKNILLEEFKVQTRQDLTEETGAQYIARLKDLLGEA